MDTNSKSAEKILKANSNEILTAFVKNYRPRQNLFIQVIYKNPSLRNLRVNKS